ncbi:MAG: hypothetical protein HYU84_02315 [Chloroflexi bacterium]|nr:hypothetical protein [Chloroflexota bacterium]
MRKFMRDEGFHFCELICAGRNGNQDHAEVGMCVTARPFTPAEQHRIAKVFYVGVNVYVDGFSKRERDEIFHRQQARAGAIQCSGAKGIIAGVPMNGYVRL